jgi:hypothetical protein
MFRLACNARGLAGPDLRVRGIPYESVAAEGGDWRPPGQDAARGDDDRAVFLGIRRAGRPGVLADRARRRGLMSTALEVFGR